MSLFGRWSQDDKDYADKAALAAKRDLHARLISAQEAYEKNPTPAARKAMDDAHRQLRDLG